MTYTQEKLSLCLAINLYMYCEHLETRSRLTVVELPVSWTPAPSMWPQTVLVSPFSVRKEIINYFYECTKSIDIFPQGYTCTWL